MLRIILEITSRYHKAYSSYHSLTDHKAVKEEIQDVQSKTSEDDAQTIPKLHTFEFNQANDPLDCTNRRSDSNLSMTPNKPRPNKMEHKLANSDSCNSPSTSPKPPLTSQVEPRLISKNIDDPDGKSELVDEQLESVPKPIMGSKYPHNHSSSLENGSVDPSKEVSNQSNSCGASSPSRPNSALSAPSSPGAMQGGASSPSPTGGMSGGGGTEKKEEESGKEDTQPHKVSDRKRIICIIKNVSKIWFNHLLV